MDESLMEHLRTLELRLLAPEVRASKVLLEQLLHPEFVEFGASGRRFARADIVAELAVEDGGITHQALDFELVVIADDVAQLRYRSVTHGPAGARHAWRSSLWRRDETGWRMLFHQGTVIAD